jgi:hypothetical protein
VQGCTRTWTFAGDAPETPPIDAPPEPEPQPAVEPEPEPQGPPAPAAAEPVPPGWTLREVPGSSPLALGGGTGRVASLAAFCLSGQPFLAVRFAEPPENERVTLGLDFSQGTVEVEALREETAGGSYVAPLAEGPLAARLAGRDAEVRLRAGAVDEGVLSLDGSTRAIRDALETCHGF